MYQRREMMNRGVVVLLFFSVVSMGGKCQFFPGPPDHPELCWPSPDNDKDCRFPLMGRCMEPSIYIRYDVFQCYNYYPNKEELDNWNNYYYPQTYQEICDMK